MFNDTHTQNTSSFLFLVQAHTHTVPFFRLFYVPLLCHSHTKRTTIDRGGRNGKTGATSHDGVDGMLPSYQGSSGNPK